MKDETRLIHASRGPRMERLGVRTVNPAIQRGSTYLYDDLEHMAKSRALAFELGTQSYGISGGDMTLHFQDSFNMLEHGARGVAVGSGMLACSLPLLALLKSGDHLLMVDSVYGPVRQFCDGYLPRINVEVTYYDPLASIDELDKLRQSNTTVVYLETPGSVTFEMQDVPAVAAWAKERGLRSIIDNTWASPLYFKPLDFGVDVSTHAATKYICGHSDVISGAIICNADTIEAVEETRNLLGLAVAPDEAYLGLRGIRTMPTRMPVHWKNGLELAQYLMTVPEVANVLHPAMPHDPGYAIWERDFTGASGLFSIVLREDVSWNQMDVFLKALTLYGMGFSWGGFESLVVLQNPKAIRTGSKWPREGVSGGYVLRFHAGLEAPEDLIADCDQAFHAMRAA